MNGREQSVEKVREYLKEDRTREALDMLLNYTEEKSEEYKLLVSFSASLSRVRRCFHSSLIPFETYHSEITKVVLGLLELVDSVFEEKTPSAIYRVLEEDNVTLVKETSEEYLKGIHLQPAPPLPLSYIIHYHRLQLDEKLANVFNEAADEFEKYINKDRSDKREE